MSHSQRANLQPTYVLHRRPYRNSSLILELLTRDHGRVGLIARGARKPRSRYHGLLGQFQPLLVSWSGRGEISTLTGVERHGDVMLLHGQILICGFYINELLMRLLHRDDPCPEIYQSYGRVLTNLAEEGGGSESILRIFEKNLLEALGYGLALECDVETGQAIRPECVYNYYMNKGPVAAADIVSEREMIERAGRVEGLSQANAGQQTLVKLHGSSLIALARGELSDRISLRETKRLTRMALGKLLGNKPLNSRSLFNRKAAGIKSADAESGCMTTLE